MTLLEPPNFACRHTLPAKALRLSVDGIGKIALPVTEARARALVAAGAPAPFGLGERTLTDPAVRDVTEIDAARVSVDADRWRAVLDPALEKMRIDLGLPPGRLDVRLHKLLVYAPGGFFLPHRDTERGDSMIGTLVIVLPCPHRGGALVIEHAGRKRRLVSAGMQPDALLAFAFYGDCPHEVRPVTEGYRIVLSHELHFEAADDRAVPSGAEPSMGTPARAVPPVSGVIKRPVSERVAREDAALDRVLRHFFDPADRKAPPTRLVYLLDHRYSRGSLDWHRLKGGDGEWARRLCRAGARLDLHAWLALVTIRETWSTESVARLDPWRFDEEDDDEDYDEEDYDDDADLDEEDRAEDDEARTREDGDAAGTVRTEDGDILELVDLVDAGRVLEHLRDARGVRRDWPPMRFADDELCRDDTRPLPEPDEMTHQGYTGNEGDTLERRYDHAAVVLWPVREHWKNLLDAGLPTLLHELLHDVEDRPGESLAAFGTLGDRWPPFTPVRDSDALADALALAARWNDADATIRLLGGFDIAAVQRPRLRALARLGASYGSDLARRLVDLWFDPRLDGLTIRTRERFHTARARAALEWLPLLPAFAAEIGKANAETIWRPALAHLLARLLAATLVANALGRRDTRPSARRATIEPETTRWRALIDATDAVANPASIDALTDALLADIERAGPEVGIAVVEHLVARGDAPLGAGRARELRRRVRANLDTALEAAGRAEGDWSLPPLRGGCDCAHCRALKKFVKSADARTLEVTAVQPERRHVEHRVQHAELPLDARTIDRGRGRAHTLVLAKRATLFEDARREARRWREAIARLEKLDGRSR